MTSLRALVPEGATIRLAPQKIMSNPPNEYLLKRGEVCLGRLFIVADAGDMPWFVAHLEKDEAFRDVAPLFERLAENERQSRDPNIIGIEPEKRAVRAQLSYEEAVLNDEIRALDLRIVDVQNGALRFKPSRWCMHERGYAWMGKIFPR